LATERPFLAQALLGDRWATLASHQLLLVIKTFLPEKMVTAIQDYIQQQLGASFVATPLLDLNSLLNDSTCTTPILFVLGQGGDPSGLLQKFARSKGRRWLFFFYGCIAFAGLCCIIARGCRGFP